MSRQAATASPSVARLLRGRRRALRLTLDDVARQAAEHGEPISVPTLVRIESGRSEPALRKLTQLLRIYDLDVQQVVDLIEAEQVGGTAPESLDLDAAYSKALALCREGQLRAGMGYLAMVRELAPGTDDGRVLRQKAILSFAISARDLGRLRVAERLLDELLSEPPDISLRFNVLLVSASLWLAKGSCDAAFAFLTRAEAYVGPDDHLHRAWLRHQVAKVHQRDGRPEEGLRSLEEARALYATLGDAYEDARAGLLHLQLLEAAGRLEDACAMARREREAAERNGFALSSALAAVHQGRLAVQLGSFDGAVEPLTQALAKAVVLQNHHVEFLAHYYLWRTFRAQGERTRARLELEAARHVVKFVDTHTAEAEEIRGLNHTRRGNARGSLATPRSSRSAPPRTRS